MPHPLQLPPLSELPAGPRRDLTEGLFVVYTRAGRPSLRDIRDGLEASEIEASASTETIRRALTGRGSRPPRWEAIEGIYLWLAQRANIDPDARNSAAADEPRRAHLLVLWNQAVEAANSASGLEVGQDGAALIGMDSEPTDTSDRIQVARVAALDGLDLDQVGAALFAMGPSGAGAALVKMDPDQAAAVLDRMDAVWAGVILRTMVDNGAILDRMDPAQAAAALHQMDAGAAAMALERMDPARAVAVLIRTNRADDILDRSNVVRAADFLGRMDPNRAAIALGGMDRRHAAAVLHTMDPARAAATLDGIPFQAARKVFQRMKPAQIAAIRSLPGNPHPWARL